MASLILWKPFVYDNTDYPTWALVMGWIIALIPLSAIPIYFCKELITNSNPNLSMWEVSVHFIHILVREIVFQDLEVDFCPPTANVDLKRVTTMDHLKTS